MAGVITVLGRADVGMVTNLILTTPESKFALVKVQKSAGILRMKTNQQTPKLFVVIQEGGTSNEHYAHQFDSEEAAKRYIRTAERAAYNCYGPFELSVPVTRPSKINRVKRAADTD